MGWKYHCNRLTFSFLRGRGFSAEAGCDGTLRAGTERGEWLLSSGACGIAVAYDVCYLSRQSMMQDLDFGEIVDLICREDARYDKKAYLFVRQGLDSTVKSLKKHDPERVQRSPHVSGRELLEGLRTYALDQYGPLTKTVFESWGVRRCADFGEIVFNLIEYNVFSKTEDDRREDFADLYNFEEAFVKPFQPTGGKPSGPSAERVGSP